MAASRSIRILLLLLLVVGAFGQSRSISLAIFPVDSTLFVGQTECFTAVIMGTNDAAIQWAVLEAGGGTITQDGIYTAPENIGIYHVVAIAASNGERAQTAVKVTVVMHYDAPPNS